MPRSDRTSGSSGSSGSGRARLAPGLVRRPRPPEAEPVWDAAARRVLDHDAGPLRVIGGPGTGKTTLLLAAVAARVAAGTPPERTLLLVGSRRAAGELRERLIERLPAGFGPVRTSREPLVRTVHSYAFGVLRLFAARNGDPPPRLLASAEQDAVVRDLLLGELFEEAPDSGWPARLRPAIGLPGFAAELRELLLRAAERGLGPDELAELGRRHDVAEWVGRRPVLPHLRARDPAARGGRPGGAAGHCARPGRRRAGVRGARRAGRRPGAAGRRAATGAPSGGRRRTGSRSAAAGAGPHARPHRPVGAAGRGPGSGRAHLPRGRPGRAARGRGRDGGAAYRSPQRHRCPGRGGPARCPAARLRPGPGPRRPGRRAPRRTSRGAGRRGRGRGAHLRLARPRRPGGWPISCAAPTSAAACRGRGWRCWSAPPVARCRRCAGRCSPPACRSPPRPTSCRWPASRPWCRC